MPSFYFPFSIKIDQIPLIVYPCIGIEKVFDRQQANVLEEYLHSLYLENKELLSCGEYQIIILWNDGEDKMTDIWIFDKVESWGSGPLVDAKVFRNLQQETTTGISAGDGLIMLGRETELEEELRKSGKSVQEYLDHPRASLPNDIAPQEHFALSV